MSSLTNSWSSLVSIHSRTKGQNYDERQTELSLNSQKLYLTLAGVGFAVVVLFGAATLAEWGQRRASEERFIVFQFRRQFRFSEFNLPLRPQLGQEWLAVAAHSFQK